MKPETVMKTGIFAIVLLWAVLVSCDLVRTHTELNITKAKGSELVYDMVEQRGVLSEIFGVPITSKTEFATLSVTATAYSACREETDNTPHQTATGSPSLTGVIAVSKDLESYYGIRMGDIVVVRGHGAFVVDDRMNARFTKRIDILAGNKLAATIFGSKQVDIIYVRR